MQQISRYEILDELGRGAMGVVWRARDPSIGRLVAIKTIRLTDFSDATELDRLRERLRREAQSAGVLSHPNIVVVYDVGQEGEMAYIAMEFVQGLSLEAILAGHQTLTKGAALEVLRQTAAGLDFAHKKGIVHRDIKPANILIGEGQAAKITDFGVAKIAASNQLTQTGTVLGTPNYMSPEQIQGKEVDGRADQFALAVIAYEVLTGERPFSGEQLTTVLYKIVSEKPVPAHTLNPSLGWPVSMVLEKALSKDPKERFKSCTEFMNALETALKGKKDWAPVPRGSGENLPTAVVGTTVQEQVAAKVEAAAEYAEAEEVELPPEPKRRRALAVVLTLVAAFAIGGGTFFALNHWAGQDRAGMSSIFDSEAPAEITGRPSPMPGAPVETAGQEPAPPMDATLGEEASGQAGSPDAPASQEASAAEVAAPKTAPASVPVTQPQAPAAPPQDQSVQVITDPPGAEVTFDNDSLKICKAPCEFLLPAGRHTLTARLAGYRNEMRIFEITGPRELSIALQRQTGTLRVESTPPGARITLNGVERKETTPSTFVLPIGKYEVIITKDGRKDRHNIVLRDGALLRVSVELSP